MKCCIIRESIPMIIRWDRKDLWTRLTGVKMRLQQLRRGYVLESWIFLLNTFYIIHKHHHMITKIHHLFPSDLKFLNIHFLCLWVKFFSRYPSVTVLVWSLKVVLKAFAIIFQSFFFFMCYFKDVLIDPTIILVSFREHIFHVFPSLNAIPT